MTSGNDIITHAGTSGERSDDIAQVRVFHNLDNQFGPYQHGQRVREVFAETLPAKDPYKICDDIDLLLNIGDDPTYGTPDPSAVEYRRRGHRSLSVGDVIAVDDEYFSCDSLGFGRIGAPRIVSAADLTPGFSVTETQTGRAVAPGDVVYDVAGVRGIFQGVSGAPANGGAAKVTISGHEFHAGMYNLDVRTAAEQEGA